MAGNNYTCNSVSFGLNNPMASLHRAEQLKKAYASKGLNYIMPKDVWSNKKISKQLMNVYEYLKYFSYTKTLTKETVQAAINSILPKEEKGSILIKDLTDIESSMLKKGYSRSDINDFKDVVGLTLPPNDNVKALEIFADFNQAKGNKYEQEELNRTILHELQHALKGKFQNEDVSDRFKRLNTPIENRVGNSFFHKFESEFFDNFTGNYIDEISDKELYKALNVYSRDDLYEKFAKTLDKLEKEDSKSYAEYINNKKFGKFARKDFFESMKHSANDEKMSYMAETKTKEPYDYTENDLLSKLYSEMARFFARLKKNAKF